MLSRCSTARRNSRCRRLLPKRFSEALAPLSELGAGASSFPPAPLAVAARGRCSRASFADAARAVWPSSPDLMRLRHGCRAHRGVPGAWQRKLGCEKQHLRLLGELIAVRLPAKKWCPGWDSNPHTFRYRFLRPTRLPFRHPGAVLQYSGTCRARREQKMRRCDSARFPKLAFAPKAVALERRRLRSDGGRLRLGRGRLRSSQGRSRAVGKRLRVADRPAGLGVSSRVSSCERARSSGNAIMTAAFSSVD